LGIHVGLIDWILANKEKCW